MNHFGLAAFALKVGFLREPALDHVHEPGIDFDDVEPIAGPQVANDFRGDGAGAGTDFENAARRFRQTHRPGQRSTQRPARRQDRAGGVVLFAKLAEERPAFRPVPHGRPRVD